MGKHDGIFVEGERRDLGDVVADENADTMTITGVTHWRRPYHRPMFEKICNIGKPRAEGSACGFPPMPDYLVPPFFKSEYFKHEITDGQNEFIGEWLRFRYLGDERWFNLG
jgi:hypothetical protein